MVSSRLLRWGVLGILAIGVLLGAILFFGPEAPPPTPPPDENISAAVTTVATDLTIPWGVAFLPDGDMLATERPGTLVRIEDGAAIPVEGVAHRGEGGLQGVAVHPDFVQNRWIYLYMTTAVDGGLENRVVRYRLDDTRLSNPTTIIDGIPGAPFHDGGRLAFGPDGALYITTGDATRQQLAQDRDTLAGKILRLRPDGSIPADNPFDSPVYSYGHRNPQGLAWDGRGTLWATEHGNQAKDEMNRIEPGANYGWPVIRGDETRDGMVSPAAQSGTTTWAPAGAAYVDGRIIFAGLRGAGLYVAKLNNAGTDVASVQKVFNGYGRMRAVELGPDGFLYVTTSNRDGRGTARAGDDRILRIDPAVLAG